MLSSQDFQKIVYDWNNTGSHSQPTKTIIQLIERQATMIPDNVALIFEDQQLTYKELNQKSNQLNEK